MGVNYLQDQPLNSRGFVKIAWLNARSHLKSLPFLGSIESAFQSSPKESYPISTPNIYCYLPHQGVHHESRKPMIGEGQSKCSGGTKTMPRSRDVNSSLACLVACAVNQGGLRHTAPIFGSHESVVTRRRSFTLLGRQEVPELS